MNKEIKIKVFKETAKIEPFEYEVPEVKTLQVLREDGLEDREIPPLESSWIDDYMMRYFSKYPNASEQDAIDSFLGTDYPAQIETRLQNLLNEIDDSKYERLLSETADVKTLVTEKALGMGADTEDTEKLEDIELQKAVGTSMAGAVKLGQVLRKAKDYLAVFTEESFDDVLAAEARLTLGHEYGHQLCRAMGVASSEMNAEFWGRASAKNEKETETMRKSRAVMVAKSYQVISTIKQANLQNIQSIMATIADKTSDKFPLLSQLALARADLYGQHYAEDYASPTSDEEMAELIGEARLRELAEKYNKLLEYAKDQRMVVIYRAEGSHNFKSPMERMGVSENVTGTWYGTTPEKALYYYDQVKNRPDTPTLYSVIVPESVVASLQEPIDKANNEVKITLSPSTIRTEIATPEEAPAPTLENYMHQFDFVREYEELKAQLNNQ